VKARSAPLKLCRDFDVAESRQIVAEIGNLFKCGEQKKLMALAKRVDVR
jgi:hypothetical protein